MGEVVAGIWGWLLRPTESVCRVALYIYCHRRVHVCFAVELRGSYMYFFHKHSPAKLLHISSNYTCSISTVGPC